MSKKSGKKKSAYCKCKGVTADCKLAKGYKPRVGGGCPVKVPAKSTLKAKKTSAPKQKRLTKAQKMALLYHGGGRGHSKAQDDYFANLRSEKAAAENAGAMANWQMAELFPGMNGLRGFRGLRGSGGKGRQRRAGRGRGVRMPWSR